MQHLLLTLTIFISTSGLVYAENHNSRWIMLLTVAYYNVGVEESFVTAHQWEKRTYQNSAACYEDLKTDAPLPLERFTTYPFAPRRKVLSSLNWSSAVTSASATGSRTSLGVLDWVFIHLPNAFSAISSPTLLRSALSLRT